MKYLCKKSFTAITNKTSYGEGVKISVAEFNELNQKEKLNFEPIASLSKEVRVREAIKS